MAHQSQFTSSLRKFLPLLTLALFALSLVVIHDALRQFQYHHLLQQLKNLPLPQILIAFGLTLLSYLVLTLYDRLGLAYIRHPLDAGKVTLASFISYAFTNNLGLSLLTSGSIRYRLYSAWGLSAEEIARLVVFTALTFWLGILTVAGLVFSVEPLAMQVLAQLSIHSMRPLGLIFSVLVIAYLVAVALRHKPLRVFHWELALPSLRLAAMQLLVGAVDWMLAGCVLYVLLPKASQFSFFAFLGIYLLAQIVALISHVPGGLGVFESMILLSAPTIPADALIGAMLVYRAIYYLLPLAVAALLLSGNELWQSQLLVSETVGKTVRRAGRWWGALIPQLLAATTLLSGAVLLFSGATPAAPGRLHWLTELLPLSVIELSHFLGSLVGVGLLLLARGLQRRLDAAYLLTAMLLGVGSLLSLLKGADYEEALLLGLMLAALLPCRKHFYRRASLFSEPFGLGWSVTLLLVLASSIGLTAFAYQHLDYSSELWWQFTLHGDAPRSLRAAVGATTLLLCLTVARLLRPAPQIPGLPGPDELDRVRQIIRQSPDTAPNLALLGDKALLFDQTQRGFVMYGIAGRSWVALGDPIGPDEVACDLAWKYRALVERHGGQPIFYAVDTRMLHSYLDMGLTLYKLGEEATVPLANFSLAGPERKNLRHVYNHVIKEGCSFELLPPKRLPELLPELRRISEAWLEAKQTREKGFSLGNFDEDYLLNFPVALVRYQGEIVAFANVLAGAGRQELSADLMRYRPQAPNGVMEYLFISLMLWGNAQGYQSFTLGMAPLSGLENQPIAPLWNRIGAVIFRHGEHFYNFEGLRNYKEKFDPVWEPRYLACPGGLALPRILLNIAALISGGIKGVIAK